MSVSVDYGFYDRLNIILNDFNANVENSEFSDVVNVTFSIKAEYVNVLSEKLTEQSNGKYSLNELGEKFAKV
jgi:putative IMPACT (imprinted ancient) family translation regulator